MKIKTFINKFPISNSDSIKLLDSLNKEEKPWFKKYILPSLKNKEQTSPLRKLVHIKEITKNNKFNSNIRTYPQFKNLYKFISHPQTLLKAYSNLVSNKGSMTAGIDAETLDGFSLTNIYKLHSDLVKNKYKPKPVRRVWVPKPGKPFPEIKRPLAVPTIIDRIVQEAIRIFLQPIYEPLFDINNHNYGFRPNKSTYDSIEFIKNKAKGSNYTIEGDIKGAYDSIDHNKLLEFISNTIQDDKLLNLINTILKAGVLDENKWEISLTGVPQGSILSPLLFNIYMFQFDLFMENHILPLSEIINKSQNRKPDGKRNPKYTKISNQIMKLKRKSISPDIKNDELISINKQIKSLTQTRLNTPYAIKETINIKICYTRYADDWVIFVHGPRFFPILIFNKIKSWLKQYLSLDLSLEKTLITPCNLKWVKFLGFAIRIQKNPTRLKYINRQGTPCLQRTGAGHVNVTLDTQRVLFKLRNKGFAHPEYPKSIGKKSWTNLEPEIIIKSYSSIIYGIHNYYSRNITLFRDLNWVHHLIKTSCAKTLCLKYKKKSMSVIFRKYGPDLRLNKFSFPSKKFLREHIPKVKTSFYKRDPLDVRVNWRTRLKIQSICCICDSKENVEMHHIRRLRGPTGKNLTKGFEKIMGAHNRKQIPVCRKCHKKIHKGEYDEKSLTELFNLTNTKLISL